MTIRLLHTADLHLGAPFPSLGEKAAARRQAFLQTFERLITQAIKSEVHLFLVAGDLFDSPTPASDLVGRVQAGLKRLADRGIVPVLLPGTHDHVVAADSVYRQAAFPKAILLAAPRVEEPVLVTIKGTPVHLYGFAYHGSASAEALAGMVRRPGDGVHIGLLHGSRQGSPEWEYRKKDLPFTTGQLKEWALDYVALGHYHGFETMDEGGRTWACYPGTPEGKRFGENGPRHAALVSVSPGQAAVEKIVVNTQTLEEHSVDLSGCSTPEQAAEAIRRRGRPDLLLRLSLIGIVESPVDLARLQGECEGDFFHLEIEDGTSLFNSEFARRIAHEETVRGVFVRRILNLMEEVPPEKRPVVEEAFREVMIRFNAFGGGK